MTISKERVSNDLGFINESIDKLKKLKDMNKNDFLTDFRNIDSTNYLIKTSIEIFMELWNYIVYANNWGEFNNIEKNIAILIKKKILDNVEKQECLNLIVIRDKMNLMASTLENDFIFEQLHDNLDLIEKIYISIKKNLKVQ